MNSSETVGIVLAWIGAIILGTALLSLAGIVIYSLIRCAIWMWANSGD